MICYIKIYTKEQGTESKYVFIFSYGMDFYCHDQIQTGHTEGIKGKGKVFPSTGLGGP
jgi:hypothetical protein